MKAIGSRDYALSGKRTNKLRKGALATALFCCLQPVAYAQTTNTDVAVQNFDIPAQSLASALREFAKQSQQEILFTPEVVAGKVTNGVRGAISARDALTELLSDAGIIVSSTPKGAVLLRRGDESPNDAQSASSTAAIAEGIDGIAEGKSSTPRPAQATTLNTMVVTGTHIRGAPPVGSPIVSLDREQIEKAGFATAKQVMDSLPQNFNGGASETTTLGLRDGSETNAGLGSGVNLRGLGNDSTLVLVNGRRLAPGGYGGFIDVSMIPLAAIERVDVLTDGASAIYGADAVAGVVNFILRDDYQGAETAVRYGGTADGGAEEIQLRQSLGTRWGTGHAGLAYEYYDRSRLSAADRSYSAQGTLPPTDLMPTQSRNSVFGYGSQAIGNAKLSADIYATERDSSSGLYNARFSRATRNDAKVQQYGGTVGADFAMGDVLDFDVSSTYSRSKTRQDQFNLTSGENTFTNRLQSSYWSVDGIGNIRLMQLEGGTAKLALGGHYRKEDLNDLSREASFGVTPPELQRTVKAVFGELYMPLLSGRKLARSLELSLAVRHEQYSDFGSTTNPKIGVSWVPVDGLTFRGTAGTSFRAPLLTELDGSFKQVIFLPLDNPGAPGGSTLTLIPVSSPAPDLGPERARTWTFGFDLRPVGWDGFLLSATYYDIKFEDRIVAPPSFIDAFTDLALRPLLTLNPTQDEITEILSNLGFPLVNLTGDIDPSRAEAIFDIRTRNLAVTNVRGVDINTSARWQTVIGDFAWNLNASYLLNFENRFSLTAPASKGYDIAYSPAALRARTGLAWSGSVWQASLFANYVAGYADDQTTPAGEVSSWTTWDAQVSYRVSEGKSPWGELVMAVGLHNLLNRDPPSLADLSSQSAVNIGFDPQNANPLGRAMYFEVRKSW